MLLVGLPLVLAAAAAPRSVPRARSAAAAPRPALPMQRAIFWEEWSRFFMRIEGVCFGSVYFGSVYFGSRVGGVVDGRYGYGSRGCF